MSEAKDISSVHAIFETLGGAASVARMLRVNASTASEMKRRKSIPIKYWPSLISAARVEGVRIDEAALVSAHIDAPKTGAAA